MAFPIDADSRNFLFLFFSGTLSVCGKKWLWSNYSIVADLNYNNACTHIAKYASSANWTVCYCSGHLAGGQIINVCYVHVGNKLIHSRCFSSVWYWTWWVRNWLLWCSLLVVCWQHHAQGPLFADVEFMWGFLAILCSNFIFLIHSVVYVFFLCRIYINSKFFFIAM